MDTTKNQSDSGADQLYTSHDDNKDKILQDCERFLRQSKKQKKGLTRSCRKQRQKDITLKQRKPDHKIRKDKKGKKTYLSQTNGIQKRELDRCKAARECQQCASPQGRQGSHKTLHCFRWIGMEKGKAPFPKNRHNKEIGSRVVHKFIYLPSEHPPNN